MTNIYTKIKTKLKKYRNKSYINICLFEFINWNKSEKYIIKYKNK